MRKCDVPGWAQTTKWQMHSVRTKMKIYRYCAHLRKMKWERREEKIRRRLRNAMRTHEPSTDVFQSRLNSNACIMYAYRPYVCRRTLRCSVPLAVAVDNNDRSKNTHNVSLQMNRIRDVLVSARHATLLLIWDQNRLSRSIQLDGFRSSSSHCYQIIRIMYANAFVCVDEKCNVPLVLVSQSAEKDI